ncbi:hypothetical protein Nmel_015504, partial [Mimus melanotis]
MSNLEKCDQNKQSWHSWWMLPVKPEGCRITLF